MPAIVAIAVVFGAILWMNRDTPWEQKAKPLLIVLGLVVVGAMFSSGGDIDCVPARFEC